MTSTAGATEFEAAEAAGGSAEGNDGVMARQLLAVLETNAQDPPAMRLAVRRLARRAGPAVYGELLYLLAHLRFTPGEAKRHWQSILRLHQRLETRLGPPVDIRVALVSYFVDVRQELRNPTVIELHLFQETEQSVYRDALTGLFNFRYFRDHLAREARRALRYETPLSLVMLDIDDFKAYNDHQGHNGGNLALAGVAEALRRALRDCDIPVRYGGEEFALILPGTAKPGALIAAERVRREIERRPFRGEQHQPLGRLTASLGVASFAADGDSAEALLEAADEALYLAKERGKNRVWPAGGE